MQTLAPTPLPDLEAGTRFGCLSDGRLLAVFARPAVTARRPPAAHGQGGAAAPLAALAPTATAQPGAPAPPNARQEVVARTSLDDGDTWTDPSPLLDLGPEYQAWGLTELLVDQEDELHLFFLIMAEDASAGEYASPSAAEPAGAGDNGTKAAGQGGEAERPLVGELVDRRIDIGYVRSHAGRTQWSVPRVLWVGYTGALNSVVQLRSGRILLPFSLLTRRAWADRGKGPAAFTFLGQFDATLIFSDDGGQTWQSGPRLSTPVPDIVSAYGAVEPVVVERGDGVVWMLIRTQMGRFWESLSRDGTTWSPPAPTPLLSSDSPAGLVRLSDGRLVLFWNNCLRYPYAYGGRQVLHAAVSADHGRSWQGFREVGRDPLAAQPPPPHGDHGTAYPFPRRTGRDQVIFVSGQGAGRAFRQRLDPAWLLTTHHAADLAARPQEWSRFGTQGVDIAADPETPARCALRLHPAAPEWPAAAVWNFPAGSAGALRLRLRLEDGAAGALLLLSDHFSAPCDLEDELNAVYAVRVGPAGNDAVVSAGAWHDVELRWARDACACTARVDGRQAARVPALRRSSTVCYLRLRPLGQTPADPGFAVAAAKVRVTPPGAA